MIFQMRWYNAHDAQSKLPLAVPFIRRQKSRHQGCPYMLFQRNDGFHQRPSKLFKMLITCRLHLRSAVPVLINLSKEVLEFLPGSLPGKTSDMSSSNTTAANHLLYSLGNSMQPYTG